MTDTTTSAAVSETPATSAPSTSTTPAATSTPTSASPAPSRPTSMADAFERTTAKRAAAAVTQPGEAPATAAPAAPTPGVEQPAPKGPVPFETHKTALENARKKERETAQAEWDAQYGWARNVDRAAVQEAVRVAQLLQTDRAGFVRELISDTADPALISEFARVLSSRRGQSAAAVDLEPDVQVVGADGNPVAATFSAQKVKAIVDHAVQTAVAQALEKEIAPIKRTTQAIEVERANAERKTFALSTTDTLRKLPHFKEHEAAIKATFAKMPLRNPDDPREIELALRSAYADVLTSQVIPNLSRTEQAAAVASLKQKAVAQVETPSGAATTPSVRPKTPQELAKYMQERAAARSRG